MTQLNGIEFLIIYGLITLYVVVITVILRYYYLDKSLKYGIKPVTSIDPFQIAYLRGGIKEVVKLGLLSLVEHQGVEIINKQFSANFKVKTKGVEAILQGHLSDPKSTERLTNNEFLLTQIKAFSKAYDYELEKEKLIFSEKTKNFFQVLRILYLVLFLGSFGLRTIMGITNGQPFGFLVISMIVGAVFILLVTHLPRLTERGERYRADLLDTYKPKLHGLVRQEESGVHSSEETLVLASIFGVGALTEANSTYATIEAKRTYDSVWDGNSSGGGCGSGGDGGGGSSGCGGGGCGGCGGGGCGGG